MNPLSNTITFSTKKPNYFYAIKDSNNNCIQIQNPKKGDKVYEIPIVSGGSETKALLLQIPIPLCEKHQHNGNPFGVQTCNDWEYIAIPTPLGSLKCRECHNELFLPEPYLRYADLSSADLSSADLSSANFSSADLSYANFSSANLRSANLRYANFSSADLRSANLRSADFSYANLRSASLRYADLSSADLSSADFSYADFSYADLSYASLRSANLRYADLRSANLSSADLRSAININVSLTIDQAYWNKFTQIDNKFKKLLSKERFLK